MSAHIPIGYKVENGVPVVDDEKATAVRNLFIFYISGYSLNNAALFNSFKPETLLCLWVLHLIYLRHKHSEWSSKSTVLTVKSLVYH